MKTIAKMTNLLFLAALLVQSTSCAWFQKNEPKLICAAESTISDLPELQNIVITCAAISVSTANIIPCILAAVGSKWTEDVIACVASAITSSPAVVTTIEPGAVKANTVTPENLARLKTAVNEKWGARLGSQ